MRRALPRRIVFVAPYGYPALAGGATGFGYVGGAEMQQARLARVLVGRGHDVWMVSADFGQPARTTVAGVQVERAYAPFAGLPGLRFFHPRLSGLWAALSRVDADVVYQRTAGALTGLCALWARRHGRRFVYACAHDYDVLARSPVLRNPRDAWLYRHGLHAADRVLAQSEEQVAALAANHGLDAVLVPNVIDLPRVTRPDAAADAVVWVGTVKPEKRPEWILAAAAALPGVRFVVAGGPPPPPASDAAYRSFLAAARTRPNVEVLGFVAPDEVQRLLARARIFAHTSPSEGFPNTLLEAWAQGVPSVSAVDPGGAVSSAGVGVIADDEPSFCRAVGALWDDGEERRRRGEKARRYVAEHHGPEAVASAFEAALGFGAPPRVDA
ncbi:MAG: glycosyltransferase family 4 protein [Candidatus Eisenbacteria bacterium]